MSAIYITTTHDALDLICNRHYGTQSGAVEAVLEANPNIAPVAHRLPVGVEIKLPVIAQSVGLTTVRLWD